MGYDLTAANKDLDEFHFGAFSWPTVLAACGYLFPYVMKDGRWFHAPEVDPLVTDKNEYGYRLLGSNDDFRVSSADSKLIARCARNYAALNDPERGDARPEPIRADWIARMREFADWAEKSKGFWIG